MAHTIHARSPWVTAAEERRLVAAEYSAGRPADASLAIGRRVYTVADLQAASARVAASAAAERIGR